MSITLNFLNQASSGQFAETLHGIYEHSPWIPQRAAAARPFANITALKLAMQRAVREAGMEA